jgi:putative nucleotidyltransferase with HDIG domain
LNRGSAAYPTLVSGVGLVGAFTLFWALTEVALWPALVVTFTFLIVEASASRLRDEADVSLSNIVVFVAVLAGGAALGTVSVLGAIPVVVWKVRSRLATKLIYNIATFAISAAAAGLTYEWLIGASGRPFPHVLSILSLLVAAAVYTVVNHILIAAVLAIVTADGFADTLRSFAASAIMLQIPYAGIAVIGAVVLLYASPWALLLMAVPTLIARYGLLAFQRLDESYDRLVRSFVKAIEIKDLYTRGHSERVAELSVHVAEELGVPYDERRLTRYAALLHDVGKIGVPLCIINKPGPLDDDEFEAIKRHPSIGADILHDIDFLAPAIDIVRYHHERLDGCGYPHGVGEEELSDIVRIVTAVDAFDAMTSTRSYRRAVSVKSAVAELRRCAGTQFDPRMVEALARAVDRIGWAPTVEFASEKHLNGERIPLGTAQERLGQDVRERAT